MFWKEKVNSWFGFVDTEILDNVPKEILNYSTKTWVQMKRFGARDQIGQTIIWVLSDEQS